MNLNSITQFVFAAEQGRWTSPGMVESAWFEQNVDRVVDAQVDAAVDRINGEED